MSYRPERLAHELKSEVSAIISRGLHDPRVGFATVTQVRVSPDLRHARVFVSIFEAAEKQRETLAALNHAAGFIRREATSRLRLRRSPELVFALDESVERGDRMSRLIEEISQELSPENPDLTPDPGPATINHLSHPDSESPDQQSEQQEGGRESGNPG
ncbi:MAG TPA: 30S ribosome-binding factor RbfA [Blastocatellia bacterium]|nr:30S ribosome-binding factor RbfA [Blastocatellia bacterium]